MGREVRVVRSLSPETIERIDEELQRSEPAVSSAFMHTRRVVRMCLFALGLAWTAEADPPASPSPPRIPVTSLPKPCDVLKVDVETSVQFASSPSQFWPSYEVEVGGIVYVVGVDKSRRVRFIHTISRQFRTPEGVDLGWTYDRLQKAFKRDAMCERGWACFVGLPSGWAASFMKLGPPVEANDKIGSFFQRGWCS